MKSLTFTLSEKQIQLLVILTKAFAENKELRKQLDQEYADLDDDSQIEANTLYSIMQVKANNAGIPTV